MDYKKTINISFWFAVLCLFVWGKQIDSTFSFLTPDQEIFFSSNGDLLKITSKYSCEKVNNLNHSFANSDQTPLLKLTHDNHHIDSCIQSAHVEINKNETDSFVSFRFTSSPLLTDIRFIKEYKVNKKNRSIQFSVSFHGDSSGTLYKNTSIQLNSRLSNYAMDKLEAFYIGDKLNKLEAKRVSSNRKLAIKQWAGFHNRFWCLSIQPENLPSALSFDKESITLPLAQENQKLSFFNIYCGPIVYQELKQADPKLTFLLYPMPFWMRWLSMGFLLIFNTLIRIFNNVPFSLVLLSVCVKIILAPLFKLASIWQKKVNIQTSILQPRLNEIKRKYKGEEQTKQTLAVYKELGISPLYTLKSLLSAAIQIPVFFAAYDMLSQHIALSNVSFMWISDLSSPDHLFRLPFVIPFFGGYFNILPFIMTSFTFASSYLHTDTSLSSELLKKQRKNLFWMAAIFFLLLYTSPAGMVIYWTMNNILAFMSTTVQIILKKHRKPIINSVGNI